MEIIQPLLLLFILERLAKVLIKNIKERISNLEDDIVVKTLHQTPVHPRNRLVKIIENIKVKKTGNKNY